MTAFAYYRLPYLHHAIYMAQHEGSPEVLGSVMELNGKEGFVVAPFAPSCDTPVLLIHPDEKKLIAIPPEEDAILWPFRNKKNMRRISNVSMSN